MIDTDLPPLPSLACLSQKVRSSLCSSSAFPLPVLPPSHGSFCPRKSQFTELGAYVDGNVEKYFNHSSNLCL